MRQVIVHEGDTALSRLYAVANAPIFTYDGSFFGREIVGGPMHSVLNLSRLAADVAVRILGGEKAGDIKVPPADLHRRSMIGGNCNAGASARSRLPPGSEVHFREPSAWRIYPDAILVTCGGAAPAGRVDRLAYPRAAAPPHG